MGLGFNGGLIKIGVQRALQIEGEILPRGFYGNYNN